MTTRRTFAAALGAGPLLLSPLHRALAQAAAYPSRPIQLVVGFPPGQASDVGARVVALRMSEELKQPVYVDNKVGAAGIRGIRTVPVCHTGFAPARLPVPFRTGLP